MNLFASGNTNLKKEIYSLQNQISFDAGIRDTAIIPEWKDLANSIIKNKTKLLEEKKKLLFMLEPNQNS